MLNLFFRYEYNDENKQQGTFIVLYDNGYLYIDPLRSASMPADLLQLLKKLRELPFVDTEQRDIFNKVDNFDFQDSHSFLKFKNDDEDVGYIVAPCVNTSWSFKRHHIIDMELPVAALEKAARYLVYPDRCEFRLISVFEK